jgi:L-2,4-diaminobutyric acid acetyltransferase
LFTSLADKLPAELQSSDWMDKQSHFAGQHDSETLIRIGPLTSL